MARLLRQTSSQLKSSLVVGIILSSLAVCGVGWYLLRINNPYNSHVVPPTFQIPSPSLYYSTETHQYLSPDGTKTLIFRVEYTSNVDTYSVFVANATERHQVYSAKLGKAASLLPPSKNNWSPDATYVFVEMSAPDAIDPLVFKMDGGTFLDGKTYLDTGKLLHQRTGYYVNSAMRWISNTQLEFSVLKEVILQPFKYIFDVENETFIKQGN